MFFLFGLSCCFLFHVTAGTMLQDSKLKKRNHETNLPIYKSLEAPLILGVAVVGLLFGCALYHLCHRKLCLKPRNSNNTYTSSNASNGDRVAQRSRASCTSGGQGTTCRQDQIINDSPPDYYGLPPSYPLALLMISDEKELKNTSSPTSEIPTTIIEEPPPAYDDYKDDQSVTREVV